MTRESTPTQAPPAERSHRKAWAQVTDTRQSALKKYQQAVVGSRNLWFTIKFDLILFLCGSMPGALGLLLRKKLYPRIFKRVGKGTVFGANLIIRHPNKIEIGSNVVISDGCALDARGDDDSSIKIGDDVILGDRAMVRTKSGTIEIGSRVGINQNATLTAVGGNRLTVGDDTMLAPYVYLGGTQYHHNRIDIPIHEQGINPLGGVAVGKGCWIGTGVFAVDGVSIGHDAIIGAGAIVRQDVPPRSVATPHQKLVILQREAANLSPGSNDKP